MVLVAFAAAALGVGVWIGTVNADLAAPSYSQGGAAQQSAETDGLGTPLEAKALPAFGRDEGSDLHRIAPLIAAAVAATDGAVSPRPNVADVPRPTAWVHGVLAGPAAGRAPPTS